MIFQISRHHIDIGCVGISKHSIQLGCVSFSKHDCNVWRFISLSNAEKDPGICPFYFHAMDRHFFTLLGLRIVIKQIDLT